jgi:uncharacterized protein YajQ (UPF0234 family)
MADQQSFDITTGCDLQEVDNAVNQAHKELTQRYDFRNVTFDLVLKRDDNTLTLSAPDDYKLSAIFEVLQQKLIKRSVPLQNLKAKDKEAATGGSVRQVYTLQQGIEADVAKAIVKFIKEQKLKKVQGSIQKEQVRVASPSRDELQEAMSRLRGHDFGIALTFGNYR